MALNIALNSALTGLITNQRALDTTATNVANVNTEGYSRKVVEQVSVVLDGAGSGVAIANITRNFNEFMLKEMRVSLADVGDAKVIDEFYGRMQDMFGTPQSNSSIGAMIADLATRFQAFSLKPEDLSLQIEVVNKAQVVAQRINDMASQIQNLRREADREIETSVDAINFDLAQIQDLNTKIAENLAFRLEAADLQDKRDVHLASIAEQMNFNSFVRDNGEAVIITPSGRRMLDRTVDTLSHSAAAIFDASLYYDGPGSSLDGVNLGGVDITSEIGSGRIAGLVELRDNVLPNLYSQLQELAVNLHNEINKVHNQGTAFPGIAVMTGTHAVSPAVPPSWTGMFRVATVDAAGIVVESYDVDLTTVADVNALLADINANMATVTASLNANNQVVLDALGADFVAVNELDSAVTVGNDTIGLSAFLGLNDFFTGSNDYDVYLSEQQFSRTTPMGFAGSLDFQGTFGAASVGYVATDTLDDVAANVNAALGPQVEATVIRDGSGYRIRISDTTGGSMFITDGPPGGLVQDLNLRARDGGIAKTIGVHNDLTSDPSRLAHAELNPAAVLAPGDVGVTTGDNTKAMLLSDTFNMDLPFKAMGLLAERSATLQEFGSAIVSFNATQARDATEVLTARDVQLDALKSRVATISGVNLDEEMANMIQLENAYAASARVMTVTDELLEILMNI